MPKWIWAVPCVYFAFQAPAQSLSPSEVERAVMPSVARVVVIGGSQQRGGVVLQNVLAEQSGFVVDQRRRYVLTWCKPVLKTGKISVEFSRPGAAAQSAAATIRECDSYTEFGVIEIESIPNFPPALQLDLEGLVLSGDQVYALGVNGMSVKIPGRVVKARNDFGLIETHSSLEASTSHAVNVEDMLHDMSPINGGPLIDKDGKVIGVNAYSSESIGPVPTLGPAPKGGIPKGTYYAQPVRSAVPIIRKASP